MESVYWSLQQIHPWFGWGWYLYIAYCLLALKDLNEHGRKVALASMQADLPATRFAVSRLVGRDTEHLSFAECNRATIESLSENLSDGVIGPLFYYLFFGVPGMVAYKVVNTLDSMVGYKTSRYLHFGWCAARCDDVLNFLPARITWLFDFVCFFIHYQTFLGKIVANWLSTTCPASRSQCGLAPSSGSRSLTNQAGRRKTQKW